MLSSKHKTFLARGKRGIVYTSLVRGKKIAIKEKNPDSTARGRIPNEARYLRLLNKHGIGPRFISLRGNRLSYAFAEGEPIGDFIPHARSNDILSILLNLLHQLFVMDKLGIAKREMGRPWKHIIITTDKKPVLLDFERCYQSRKPKNVTQFCMFLLSPRLQALLKPKGIRISRKKLLAASRDYKHAMSHRTFRKLLSYI